MNGDEPSHFKRQNCSLSKELIDILDGIPQRYLETYLDNRKGKPSEAVVGGGIS